jgi:hypothetical protein
LVSQDVTAHSTAVADHETSMTHSVAVCPMNQVDAPARCATHRRSPDLNLDLGRLSAWHVYFEPRARHEFDTVSNPAFVTNARSRSGEA